MFPWELRVFLVVWAAMIATGFWEASVEGKNYWDKGKLGWKVKFHGYVVMTSYHFYLFILAYPLMLSLVFFLVGFSLKLLGVLFSAYITGLVVEDVAWFVANPYFGLKNFNSKHVKWYPWIKMGAWEVPLFYVLNFAMGIISWYCLWS